MKQYWFGVYCESKWTAGSSWKLVYPDGRNTDAGEIVEAEPPWRLVIRWQHQDKPELKAEGESHCTMELGTQWTGGQALHHPHHRARTLEFHRGGVRRLADGHLQPEVPAGDRLHRSAEPGKPALETYIPRERR
jgi:uncharacterized protein YndB with AHSA1/START domain